MKWFWLDGVNQTAPSLYERVQAQMFGYHFLGYTSKIASMIGYLAHGLVAWTDTSTTLFGWLVL
jgi:hypothetical protein